MRNEIEFLIEQALAQRQAAGNSPPPTDCPPLTERMDVVLGRAAPEVAERVRQHCSGCPDCEASLASFRAALLEDEVPAGPPIEGSLLEVAARSPEEGLTPFQRPTRRHWVRRLVCCAALGGAVILCSLAGYAVLGGVDFLRWGISWPGGRDPAHVGPFLWVLGTHGEVRRSPDEKTLEVQVDRDKVGFLALPETPGRRWRLTAEVRQLPGNDRAQAGLFFGVRRRAGEQQSRKAAYCAFTFAEGDRNTRRHSADEAGLACGRARLACCWWDLASNQVSARDVGPVIRYEPGGGWHDIELEVSPGEVRIQFDGKPLRPIKAEELDGALKKLAEGQAPGQPADGDWPTFNPASPAGVYVRSGRVLVRDLVLQQAEESRQGTSP